MTWDAPFLESLVGRPRTPQKVTSVQAVAGLLTERHAEEFRVQGAEGQEAGRPLTLPWSPCSGGLGLGEPQVDAGPWGPPASFHPRPLGPRPRPPRSLPQAPGAALLGLPGCSQWGFSPLCPPVRAARVPGAQPRPVHVAVGVSGRSRQPELEDRPAPGPGGLVRKPLRPSGC